MSWAILLSDYPRSVLRNEESIAILAFLERQGGATEDEMLPFCTDKASLSAALLELHRNQLVDVNPAFVRITQRGKTLLDRFDLRVDIVEDVLESLALSSTEKTAYRQRLVEYREHAFPLYLNSLRSMRMWEQFDEKVLPRKPTYVSSPTEPVVDRSTAKLTILLRSLRDWLIHYPESSGANRGLVQSEEGVESTDGRSFLIKVRGLGKRSELAADCLTWFDRSQKTFWRETPVGPLRTHLHSLQTYVMYEDRMPMHDWLQACTSALSSTNVEVPFLVLLDQLVQKRLSSHDARSDVEYRIALDRADFFEQQHEGVDVLGALWASTTLEDFARLSAHDVDGARDLIEGIRTQCERILDQGAVPKNLR